jgi:hypothetical protein
MGSRRPLIGVVGFVCACSSASTAPPEPKSCKPEPPIEVRIEAQPIDGHRYAITARATPSADVGSIELALVGGDDRKLTFAATRAGEVRTLHATVTLDDRYQTVAAIARVPVDGVVMSRAAEVTIGDAPPRPKPRVYALPDGERAAEVRP